MDPDQSTFGLWKSGGGVVGLISHVHIEREFQKQMCDPGGLRVLRERPLHQGHEGGAAGRRRDRAVLHRYTPQ